EQKFAALLEDYLPPHTVGRKLLEVEIRNLPDYGYGVKAFTLSMIEAALEISEKNLNLEAIEHIITIGREMLHQPVEVLSGVKEVLQTLQGRYRLVMATKGDLLDQERKLQKSGLEPYFHHIEIVSEKNPKEYAKLIRHLDIAPEHFLMLGNSLKSDVLPVLELGGWAFHVPFHTTWAHERVDAEVNHSRFRRLDHIRELLNLLPE
ncbi:MAG: HAD family hydrolase, partial [Bacteroidota bacterium]